MPQHITIVTSSVERFEEDHLDAAAELTEQDLAPERVGAGTEIETLLNDDHAVGYSDYLDGLDIALLNPERHDALQALLQKDRMPDETLVVTDARTLRRLYRVVADESPPVAGELWNGRPPLGFEIEDGHLVTAENYDKVCRLLDRVDAGEMSKSQAARELETTTRTIGRALAEDRREKMYQLD